MGNKTNENEKIIENIDILCHNNSNQNNLINEINLNNQEIIRLDELINEMITDALEDIFENGIYIAIRIQE